MPHYMVSRTWYVIADDRYEALAFAKDGDGAQDVHCRMGMPPDAARIEWYDIRSQAEATSQTEIGEEQMP